MASNTYTTFQPAGTFGRRAITLNIAAAEDAPTTAAHGIDVRGLTDVDVMITNGDGLAVVVDAYVAAYDSDGLLVDWQLMTDAAGVAFQATLAVGGTLQFVVKAYDRFDLVVSSTDATAGSNKVLTATPPTV
jgi:hypothetical protein